jgi:hypothetical protein
MLFDTLDNQLVPKIFWRIKYYDEYNLKNASQYFIDDPWQEDESGKSYALKGGYPHLTRNGLYV